MTIKDRLSRQHLHSLSTIRMLILRATLYYALERKVQCNEYLIVQATWYPI
jgi:hypothetical protein